jgi:hypothetical protein
VTLIVPQRNESVFQTEPPCHIVDGVNFSGTDADVLRNVIGSPQTQPRILILDNLRYPIPREIAAPSLR